MLLFSMKHSCTLYLTLVFAALLLPACQNKSETTSQTSVDSAATITEPATVTLPEAPLTDRLRTLGLTQTGDWRGITLGDSIGAVRVSEKAAESELFEEDAKHIGYGIELKNLESMDVQYIHQNGRITAIQADLYLNDKPSVAAYTADLTAYFTARYGKLTFANDQPTWAGSRGGQVSLKNVSNGKDFGLKVLCSSENL
jgi:hypothetical protein